MGNDTTVKEMQEFGDAVIVAIAGKVEHKPASWFVIHWKTFLDGILGDQNIPSEFVALTPEEEAELSAHWEGMMDKYGIPCAAADFLIPRILDIIHTGYEIYAYFHAGEQPVTA